jgi:predicted TIM-barrel fold metal-dependent hydrolase
MKLLPTVAKTSPVRPRRALELAVNFAGASQILAGSDYPHQIGSIPKMQESLLAMRVTEDARQKILGGNAKKLLRL